jgi:hypothetical protein
MKLVIINKDIEAAIKAGIESLKRLKLTKFSFS